MIVAVAKESGLDAKSPPADALDQLIWYLGRAYFTYVGVLEKLLAERGLDSRVQPGMGLILFTLFAEDDLTIKEIARRSQMANSTLTGLISRMEINGLVERRRDAADGRLVRVRLTAEGRLVEPGCREIVAGIDAVFHDRLGEKGTRQCKKLLRTITAALRETNGAVNS